MKTGLWIKEWGVREEYGCLHKHGRLSVCIQTHIAITLLHVLMRTATYFPISSDSFPVNELPRGCRPISTMGSHWYEHETVLWQTAHIWAWLRHINTKLYILPKIPKPGLNDINPRLIFTITGVLNSSTRPTMLSSWRKMIVGKMKCF